MRQPLSGFNSPDVLKPWAETAAHLQDERVAVVWIIALQPQHARVHVRHERPAAENVGAKAPTAGPRVPFSNFVFAGLPNAKDTLARPSSALMALFGT